MFLTRSLFYLMLFFIGKLESKKEDIRYGRTVEGNSDSLQQSITVVFTLTFTSSFSYRSKTIQQYKQDSLPRTKLSLFVINNTINNQAEPGRSVCGTWSGGVSGLADIICHHYALLAVECGSTLTLQQVSHPYSSIV